MNEDEANKLYAVLMALRALEEKMGKYDEEYGYDYAE